MQTLVDFCDLQLNAKVSSETHYSYYEITHIKKYKVNGSVDPYVKIAGTDLGNGTFNGGRLFFTSGTKQD
jgi:hypothetical protein